MQQRRTRWTFRLIALVLIGFLAACGLASSPNLIHLGQAPDTQDPPAVTLYFDGDPTTFAIADLTVALALFLNPNATTAQIQQTGRDIFGIQLSSAQITGSGPNPLANFDLNGDGTPGQIQDLGVALAVFLGADTPSSVNSICQDVLGLSCGVTSSASLPRPGATPFPGGIPDPSPSPSPIPPPPPPSPSPIPGIPTIGVPQTINGSLTTSSQLDPITLPGVFYKDDYRLTGVSAGQVIRISLSSSEFDTFIGIINAGNGNVIDFNDDFGNSTNSQLDLTIQPGVAYLIRVRTFAEREVGRYQLTTALVPMMPPPPSPNPGSGVFNIEVEFIDNSLSASQRAIVLQAARRWEQIITADLPDATVTLSQGFCNGGFPPVAFNSRPVDDLLVQVTGARLLSGPGSPGGTIGQGGPCGSLRPSGSAFLPVPYGRIAIDPFDIDRLESQGALFTTVLHEMGHTLGLGTIPNWDPLLTNVGTSNPRFRGIQAVGRYNALGGSGNVPVEVTVEGHWRESLGNELMVPSFTFGQTISLSPITAAAMTDLGFGGVNVNRADPYTLPPGGFQIGPDDSERIDYGDDIANGPYFIDSATLEREQKISHQLGLETYLESGKSPDKSLESAYANRR